MSFSSRMMRTLESAVIAAVVALVGCGSSSGDVGAVDSSTNDSSVADSSSTDSARMDATDARDAAHVDAVDAFDATTDSSLPGWKLVWSDEFDGTDGAGPDPAKWKNEVGGHGWGNSEREYYTDGNKNAQQHGGDLVITATTVGASSYKCWYGTCLYTSARLMTKGLFTQKYGRFAARMKIPRGQGMWPAFWLLGDDIDTVGWPTCGEIDVMENIGKEPTLCHGTIHGPQPGVTDYGVGKSATLPTTAPLADDYHVYAIEWDATTITFLLDEVSYASPKPSDLSSGAKWVFDHPFYMLLNLAVGGSWPGDPDATTVLPQELRVDWVRVYTKS